MSKQFPDFRFFDREDRKVLKWPPARQAALYLLCYETTVTPERVCELLRVKRRPCTHEEAVAALEAFLEDGSCMRLPGNRFTKTSQMRTALWNADVVEHRLEMMAHG